MDPTDVERYRDRPAFHAADPARWRAWLTEHHDDPEPGVWLVTWRRESGHETFGYEPWIEEALAFGWIDGQASVVDVDRHALWFTRRRRGSRWTRLSKERVARVEADGRMTDAGRAVVAAAQADGSWTRHDDAEALVVPDDLAAALAARPGARAAFDAFTPGVRRSVLGWLADARRAETRERRVAETADQAARGVAAHQLRRG
ncbi:YdeI/OmpD-associated family protein [Cellulosimicrobium marinum]|uniref:YdeI/OmpD-associated family protein n=1 Tax=Cellulosimicrobium marinum TaxID=1638992 RepID=UPI001E552E96|nr:YdeI/OmpD-associated family protein [Cellulosimicrobium marinum]MCB7137896.1 YdeI/OmpD-associated family protein [Cellulosimicrobium marinum]